MNFGKTIEEQYAKISAINKLLAKYCKFFSAFFSLSGIGMMFLALTSDDKNFGIVLAAVIVLVLGFFIGKFLAGKMYGWAWISFCEKHNPAGLAKSLANATHNSAVEGYIFGGTSGAKAAASGVFIVFFFLLTFYIWKGTFYMIKYWNLPKKEAQLKKQLEKKYGKDCELF